MRIPGSVLLLTLLVGIAGVPAWCADNPLDAVNDFYRALDAGDCVAALELRPGYPKARCQAITAAVVEEANLLCKGARSAAFHITVKYTTRNAPRTWATYQGYVAVLPRGGGWVLDNDSYWSDGKISAERYLRDKAGLDPDCVAAAAPRQTSEPRDDGALDAMRRAAAEALARLPGEGTQPAEKPERQKGAQAQLGQVKDMPLSQTPSVVSEAGSMPEEREGKDVQQSGVRSEPQDASEVPQEWRMREDLGPGYYAPPDTFGSVAVLTALFPPHELEGLSSDADITKLPEPDRIPPARLVPERQLPPLSEAWRGSIRSVPPGIEIKPVALTFDLCERSRERTGYQADIVDYLRTHAVPATFYAGGKWMRSHEERALQLMADPLFEIGNHAWTHGNLRVLRGRRMKNQILWTQAQYELLWEKMRQRALEKGIAESEVGKIPALPLTFRFPYGTCGRDALQLLAELGLPAVQWSVVSGDPDKNATAEAMARHIRQSVRPGAIIICHANGRGHNTAQALPLFIPWLREQGFDFVTVSQLLRLGRPETAPDCYEVRPGDNLQYDEKFGDGL